MQKILLVCLLCSTVVGCTKPPAPAATTRPPEVVVGLPVSKKVRDSEDFTGHTEAVNSVEIRSQVTGYLEKIHFVDGADVKEGAPLFDIDPLPYIAALDVARANSAQTRARLDRVTRDFERAARLNGTTAVSKEDYDKAFGDKAEALGAFGAAEANVKLAETNLQYTHIKARFSGRIGRRMVDPGNVVKSNDTMLTTLVSLDPIYAQFDVDERTWLLIERINAGEKAGVFWWNQMPVTIGLADEEDYAHSGKIDFIDNHFDPGTGTVRVRATVSNKNLALAPGLFIRVRVPIGKERDALLVPEEALGLDQGQSYLYVLNADDEVISRRVKTGIQVGQNRVIESGLMADERVIVRGLQRVRPGVKVVPKNDEPAKK